MARYNNFKGITNPTGDIFTNPQIQEALYVNGVLTTPAGDGTITLPSASTYILSGRHYGRIIIGAETEDGLTDDTFVILDGVEIYADDSHAYGIYYASKSQSMYVTLAKNKHNTILCQYEQEMGEQQGACLYSENNMVLQGNGYLSVCNKGGHGIKASELRISGNPHIYAEAIHDGIHGNSNLVIDGGKFYINGANDAFGTGSTGSIKVFGGSFRCYNIKQNAFDSKLQGSYYVNLDLRTDAATPLVNMENRTDPIMIIGTVTVDGVELQPVDGVYTISEGVEPEIIIKGRIAGSINVGIAKSNVTLDGCVINGSLNYTLGSSNMQVNSNNDTVNIINGNLTSSNNLKLEVKGGSHLIIKATNGIAVSGSEITIHDSKGSLMISTSDESYGMQGTDIYIADSADHKTFADEAVYGYISVNTIHARTSSKGKKGNMTIKDENLKGVVCVDKITTAKNSSDTTGVNLYKSKNIFYGSVDAQKLVNDCGSTTELYDVMQIGIGAMPVNF